ncbi:Nucleoporin POM33 [Wickerhamiella sorbophila]|uniref:Nucleoporin POM33 n=1 Tax=Wickerhamiella sorbophila TaxID=45607 RepID=A0A2T0FBZ8_9ASCO|nr:Nucleoporin POM33 [Wickerhamiella sorbophila]PRT52485.1 Nucleoporin POM33 [Wickerhamiella sorbophila]
MSTPQAKADGAKPHDSKAKLAELTRTIEFKWYASHVTVVTFTMIYMLLRLFFSGRFPGFLYKMVFVAASAAFGLIVYQKYTTGQLTPAILSRDDSVHYLYLAVVWLFTMERYFAPLPFAIFSFFHALTYARSYLLPAMYATPPRELAQRIDHVVKKYNEPFTKVAAQVEFGQLIVLILAALRARKGTWIQLLLYVVFFRSRYSVSRYTQGAVKSVEVRIDNLVPAGPAKDIWLKFKAAVAAIPGPVPKPTK